MFSGLTWHKLLSVLFIHGHLKLFGHCPDSGLSAVVVIKRSPRSRIFIISTAVDGEPNPSLTGDEVNLVLN